MIWYLMMIATGQYIGPISQDQCLAATQVLAGTVACRQAQAVTTCPVHVPGRPDGSTLMDCPVFDFALTKHDKINSVPQEQ